MSLNKAVLDIRERQRIKPSSNDYPAAVWRSTDHCDGKTVDTLTIIFKTSGCWWGKAGGCTMCGFVYDSAKIPPQPEELERQFDNAMRKGEKFERFMVKIFTSGSFLDENEVTAETRANILNKLAADERIFKVLVESRPEFVTEETLKACKEALGKTAFEVAIGLETSSDNIRKNSINKGFTFEDYITASNVAKNNDASMKAYLLLKPPFLSEKEALEDIVKTVDDVAAHAQTISINLCNVQNGTYVEQLWQRSQYRTPWLWSIVEILKRTKQRHPNLAITSDPVGAGSKRGPHNCKICSRDVSDAVHLFSRTQDLKVLEGLTCDCKQTWTKVLELDDFTYGSPILDR
ncbi:archaeosine biosynthesis radical SAM protein RaSEA [Methanococcoides burtonii]|uniref:Conserved archaeal protein with Radical SAM domain n=1 Tax=Methanococcoides burtonii (strain DSM 6242 / NBRC 107633 / OCM 468 / ACE-M) TaxID=259564 RepID=Q12ZP7_METBU|nr:archaeosine biosynthesis radical SAM protein RaSEA [Methanococcoides burtonii]ABE51079.1 conserved archaeal protein with Radical SAM domain [Methanococcoides burtonii DSM 6242]